MRFFLLHKMIIFYLSTVFYHFCFVDSVYLTIADLEVTIPLVKGKLPLTNQAIIPFNYLRENSRQKKNVIFRFNDTSKYLNINPENGEVFFKENSNLEETSQISSTIVLQDSDVGDSDKALLQVNVFPLNELDCDKVVEEICYWKRAVHRVDRNAWDVYLGPLASPYLVELCPGYDVRYKMDPEKYLRIIPPKDTRKYSSIFTKNLVNYKKSKINVNVSCEIENTQGPKFGTKRRIERTIEVQLLSLDKLSIRPQEESITYNLSSQFIEKGTVLKDPQILFIVNDKSGTNYSEVITVEDPTLTEKIEPICNYWPNVAVHCSLKFKESVLFNTSSYNFTLNPNALWLEDKSLRKAHLTIHFIFKTAPEPLTKHILKLYPNNIIRIFRTAAPWARVAQPSTGHCADCKNFKIKPQEIFNITHTEGIVYVQNFKALESAPEYISVNISWTKGSITDFDEIQIRIVEEPNKTCNNIKSKAGWTFCSEQETERECEKPDVCAVSTGGAPSVAERISGRRPPHRCVWRGDTKSPNITHIYSTCTPDTQTCPDGICDSLEMLHELICPQDCTTNPVVPLKINKDTGRGIDKASGVVICSSLNQCSSIPHKPTKKKKPKEADSAPTVIPLDKTKVEMQYGNASEKYAGFNFGNCGTFCMLGVGSGIIVLSTSMIISMVFWRKNRKKKNIQKKYQNDNQEMTAPLSVSNNRFDHPSFPLNFQMTSLTHEGTFEVFKRFEPDPKWEFPRSQLTIEQTLGEGEFGRVLRAKALNIKGHAGFRTVAVKTLKDGARDSELNDLLSEFQLLREVSHPNIIGLMGVCTSAGGPVYVIIEYAEYGSLRNYLRRSRKLYSDDDSIPRRGNYYDEPKTSSVTPKDILSFAWQICNGMAYLSDVKLVHRDLAARNVLLTAEKFCKISDFGLTRDIYEDNAYLKRSKGRVPVKWMAPESLSDHIYTSKSDVWSFGVLIWELVTLGATPYPGIAVQNLFHLLKQGYRMERPVNCSVGLYKIMKSCWHIDPDKRPSFQELVKCWEQLLEDKMEYMNLSTEAVINRSYFISPFEENENQDDDDNSSEASPLNSPSRVQSEEQVEETEKFTTEAAETVNPPTEGYETPVKVPRKLKSPVNEEPQEYTDMSGKEAHL